MTDVGQRLMDECKGLVIECLKSHSAGATNQEIAEKTGLYLDVPNHKGYISWTILEHLVSRGVLEKSAEGKRGGLYRLKPGTS